MLICDRMSTTSYSYINMFLRRITQCTSVEDVGKHRLCNLLLNTSGLVEMIPPGGSTRVMIIVSKDLLHTILFCYYVFSRVALTPFKLYNVYDFPSINVL